MVYMKNDELINLYKEKIKDIKQSIADLSFETKRLKNKIQTNDSLPSIDKLTLKAQIKDLNKQIEEKQNDIEYLNQELLQLKTGNEL